MTQATKADIGKWCKFWNFYDGIYILSKLHSLDNDFYYYKNNSIFGRLSDSMYCTPLTQEQIKCLGLEE